MARPGPRATEAFDRALEQGDLANAWFYAHHVRMIPLYKALWLTILLGLKGSPGDYEAASRRFMIRFLREWQPKMTEVKKLADAFGEAGDDMSPEQRPALEGLWDLAERLRGDEPGPRPRA